MATNKNRQLKKAPIMPDYLSGIAAEHWNYLVPKLVSDGMMTDLDVPIIAMACQFWENWREAEDDTVQKRNADQYVKYMKQFGATYESRRKLELGDEAKKESSDDDDEPWLFPEI